VRGKDLASLTQRIFRHFTARICIKKTKRLSRGVMLIYFFNDMKKYTFHAPGEVYLLQKHHIPDKQVSFSFTHCDTKKLSAMLSP
jgi:hypothetical protein